MAARVWQGRGSVVRRVEGGRRIGLAARKSGPTREVGEMIRDEEFLNYDDGWEIAREHLIREDRGAMPVSRESRAHAARKATWKSRQVAKKFGRLTRGIRNRRLKRLG